MDTFIKTFLYFYIFIAFKRHEIFNPNIPVHTKFIAKYVKYLGLWTFVQTELCKTAAIRLSSQNCKKQTRKSACFLPNATDVGPTRKIL